MLYLAKSLKDISFGELMSVYLEANRENGAVLAPDETEERQIMLAEQDFFQYLRQVFFQTAGAVYAIWIVNGHYVSALRLEPYQDGYLLEALETAPEHRRKGYAAELIKAVRNEVFPDQDLIIYSHVNKRNTASIKVHERCGFTVWQDYARYIDGSINYRAYTLRCFRLKKT